MRSRAEAVSPKLAIAVLISLLLMTFSCASLSTQTVSVQNVQQSPDSYLNQTVDWGGMIVENPPDSRVLKVARRDLDQADRPSIVDRGEGFYLVRLDGLSEPEKYKSGRLIRVTGKISGVQQGTVDGRPYAYPVVAAAQIRVWPQEELVGLNYFFWYNDLHWWPYVSFFGMCPGYPSPL